MAEWDPLLLFVLGCIAVIVLAPRDYVSLAGFGIMGAIAYVLFAGRGDIVFPVFALAGAGAVLLGFRTMGMLLGFWDRGDPPPEEPYPTPTRPRADTHPDERIWR